MTNRRSKVVLFLITTIVCLGIDLGSKTVAINAVLDSKEGTITVIPGWFSLEAQRNQGGMWSLFQGFGELANKCLGGVSAIVAIVIGIWAVQMLGSEGRFFAIVLGSILGGALGNLYDRIFIGGVRDFLHFTIPDVYNHPTFNMADTFLVCGAVILVAASLFGPKRATEPASESMPANTLSGTAQS